MIADVRHAFFLRVAVPAFMALILGACDAFSPRSPEAPIEDVGTFVQPDTPDQVVANIQTAVAELNARNYRRSFSEDLAFTPTSNASARDPSVWTGWSAQEEESYFLALAEAARLTADNELGLSDVDQTAGTARFTIDASYTLRLNHRRTDLPTTLQGRLIWTIDQGEDGLWSVTSWTDRTVGDAASWSDLKAAFIK